MSDEDWQKIFGNKMKEEDESPERDERILEEPLTNKGNEPEDREAIIRADED